MFRDLKEYQEIAKIYAEKVSKPEDLDENRNQMAMKLRQKREANKPQTDSTGKVIPSTAEIRAKAAAKRGGTPAIGGGNAGASTDSGGTSKSTIKSVEQKPEVSTMTKQGKPRTKAQMMAAKRIAAGKSISDVKAENQAAMKAKAAERFKAFKAKRAAGKMNEDVTPYDIVLEYLLSTEQAATIEEANYIMTEMDAETIQSIVTE